MIHSGFLDQLKTAIKAIVADNAMEAAVALLRSATLIPLPCGFGVGILPG